MLADGQDLAGSYIHIMAFVTGECSVERGSALYVYIHIHVTMELSSHTVYVYIYHMVIATV